MIVEPGLEGGPYGRIFRFSWTDGNFSLALYLCEAILHFLEHIDWMISATGSITRMGITTLYSYM